MKLSSAKGQLKASRGSWRRIASVFGLALLGIVVSGCDSQSAEEYHALGLEQIAQDKPNAAIVEFKNAAQVDTEFAPARVELGLVYLDTGDPAGAAKELEIALTLGTDDARVPEALTMSLLRLGRFDDAAARIQEFDKGEPRWKVMRGRLGLGRNEFDAAREALEVARAVPETEAEALGVLAQVAWANSEFGEAGRHYLRSSRLDPTDREVWLGLGDYFTRTGLFDRAEEAYNKCLELSRGVPLRLLPHMGLARLKLAADDPEGAAEHVAWARARYPKLAQVNYLEGLRLYQLGDYATADESLLTVLQSQPNHLPTLYLRATVKASDGQYETAIEYLDRVVNQAPEDLNARKYLASMYVRVGKPEEAFDILEPALVTHPDDVQLNTLVGSALLRGEDPERGLYYLQRAVDLAPDQPALHQFVAMGHFVSEEYGAAIGSLDAAIDLTADNQLTRVLKALVQIREGDLASAGAVSEKLADESPDSALALNLRGAVLLARGERDAARQAFVQAVEAEAGFAPAVLNLAAIELGDGRREEAIGRLRTSWEAQKDERVLVALVDTMGRDNAQERVDLLAEGEAELEDSAAVLSRHARALIQVGRATEAEQKAERAAALAPDDVESAVLLTEVRMALGRHQQAIEAIELHADRDATDPELFYLLGEARRRADLLGGARRALEDALKLSNRSHVPAMIALARIYASEGNERAGSLVDEAVQVAGNDGAVLEAGAQIHSNLGNHDDAVDLLERVSARQPSGRVARALGRARLRAGDPQGAVRGLQQWVNQNADDSASAFTLAGLMTQAGDYPGASTIYARMLESQPDDVRLLNNLAWLHGLQGDARALEFAERAIELAPQEWAVMDTAGWLQVQLGDADAGVLLLERAADRVPDNPEVRYHLAAGMDKLGRRNSAIRNLRRALESRDDFTSRRDAEALMARLDS